MTESKQTCTGSEHQKLVAFLNPFCAGIGLANSTSALAVKLSYKVKAPAGPSCQETFSIQFSKLYAFPVGANGDALLADFLEDLSAGCAESKPHFDDGAEYLLPQGWRLHPTDPAAEYARDEATQQWWWYWAGDW